MCNLLITSMRALNVWRVISAALLACSVLSSAQAGVTERLARGEPIRLGYRPTTMPMSYLVPGQTTPVGYVTDICLGLVEGVKQALKLPNLNVTWVQTGNVQRFQYVKEGKVDLECGLTTTTLERRQKYAEFTAPHFITSMVVMTLASNPGSHLRDFKGRTLAVQTNTTAEHVLRMANAAGYQLTEVPVNNVPELFNALLSGKAEAVVEEDVVLSATRAAMPDPKRFKMLPHHYTVEALAIMYPKDDPKWKEMVDHQYATLVAKGELSRLYNKWFLQPIPPKNVSLDLKPSRYTREVLRSPSKVDTDPNVVTLN